MYLGTPVLAFVDSSNQQVGDLRPIILGLLRGPSGCHRVHSCLWLQNMEGQTTYYPVASLAESPHTWFRFRLGFRVGMQNRDDNHTPQCGSGILNSGYYHVLGDLQRTVGDTNAHRLIVQH